MSEPQTLNINAATERQIKEHLKVGVSKARLIITKRNQQPEKCFTRKSFLAEVGRMEGASKWVEGVLFLLDLHKTPKSKKPRGFLGNQGRLPLPSLRGDKEELHQHRCLHPWHHQRVRVMGKGRLGCSVQGSWVLLSAMGCHKDQSLCQWLQCILLISNHRYNLDLAWGVLIGQSVLGGMALGLLR